MRIDAVATASVLRGITSVAVSSVPLFMCMPGTSDLSFHVWYQWLVHVMYCCTCDTNALYPWQRSPHLICACPVTFVQSYFTSDAHAQKFWHLRACAVCMPSESGILEHIWFTFAVPLVFWFKSDTYTFYILASCFISDKGAQYYFWCFVATVIPPNISTVLCRVRYACPVNLA